MNKTVLFFLSCITLCTASTTPKFEMGIVIGDPVGISLKWWYGTISAFDLTTGWSFPKNGRLNFQVDYLLHLFRVGFKNGEMPIYIGLGPMLEIKRESFFGGRIPIGFTYLFRKLPLSFFGEVAPQVEIIPETVWGVDGGVGVRLAF